jgi:hypothetical protein
MRSWLRLIVVLAVQLAILVAVPFRQVVARLRGTTVTLKTAPVDPFDVLAGHYVTLAYEVERVPARLADPGLQPGDRVWVTVAQGQPAWTLESVTRERPAPASGRASIRARWKWTGSEQGLAELEGAGRLYVTEERGKELDARRWGRRESLVDLRIGEDGTPAVLDLRAGEDELRAE